MSARVWFVVKCVRCGHQWDEEDPEAEVCACIEKYGQRTVEIISAGATNAVSMTVCPRRREPA